MRSRHYGTAALFASCLALVASAFSTSSCDSGSNSDGGDDDVINGGDGPSVDGSGGDGSGGDGDLPDGADPTCNVPNCAISIALGLEHGCALAKDGTVRCWGLNSLGQLGIGPGGMIDGGAYDTKNVGNKVMGLGPAKAITAGYYHTCALLQNDEVWCWGDNSRGQLAMPADGGPQAPVVMPVKINAAPAGITELMAGGWHTCALSGGMVTCWGLNSAGQQGTGSGYDGGINPNFITAPQAVPNVSGVSHIGLGDQFTCLALASNVQCFGSNSFGQLARGGDAGQPPFSQNPANSLVLTTVTALAKSNGSHECALTPSPMCWGRDQGGQVDENPSPAQSTPVAVAGLMGAVEIAPGGTHTCARIDDRGVVQCWGLNSHGQTGDMNIDPEAGVSMPLAVGGIKNALQVASGWGDFSCALVQGGAVWCWGANFEGQLGRGGNAAQVDNVPAKVVFP
jgi:alpha-tubulin suppressor-like RCC1 family protein